MKKINKSFIVGAGAIMLAATLWSLDGTIIRPNFYKFPAINVVFIEHLLGAIILLPFIFLGWQKIKNISKKSIFDIVWICIFGGLLGTLAITEAYFAAFRGDTTFSTIIILQKLQPIFALLLARIILKEKFKPSFYIWASIGIGSAYMIAFGGMGKDVFNIDLFSNPAFYAILAAFAFGSSTVFGKDLVDKLGFRVTVALRFLITSIFAFIAILLFGKLSSIATFEPLQWKLFGVIIFTTGAFAVTLYYFGLKKVNASSASIFELAWPLSGVVFDYVFNKNVLTPMQIIFSIILIFSFFMIIKEGKLR